MTTSLKTRHASERGFTLMELLVSMTITSIAMAMVVGGALTFRSVYFTDVTRTRINGNLRSAMDIVSMNIRQAGENMLSSFPAVLLTDAAGSSSDILTLRRGLVPEVLTLCEDVAAGSHTLNISKAGLANAECVPSNVAPLYTVFDNLRDAEATNILRLYIYDKSTHEGEFIDYISGDASSGQYVLTTTAVSRAYSQLNTSLYYIEEYQFQFDSVNSQLVLYIDGNAGTPQPVAFDITNFQVLLEMDDNTNWVAFNASSAKEWKDIRQIQISLSGQNSYKGHTMSSTITSKYFPRNVLSYEG
jgi:prepilin-type N-terminal cleavage/methylation domain-containing protein